MARCEISGKKPVVKNLVSHSNIKTKSTSHPNVQNKRLFSAALNQHISFKVSTGAIRAVEHCGGFDTYLLRQCDDVLSKRALTVKKRILRKMSPAKKSKTPKQA